MTAGSRLTLFSLATLACFASATQSQAASNRINGVRVSTQGESTVVEISGERAPNFTTFKQDEPRRVIVDVAECNLGSVPPRIQVDGGLVERVTTAQFGSSPHGISRVIIGLSREAEYRVTTRGGSLFVHLSPGAGGLLVSAGVPVAPPRSRPSKGSETLVAKADLREDLDLPLDVAPPAVADQEHAAPSEPGPTAEPVDEPAPTLAAAPAPVEEPTAEVAEPELEAKEEKVVAGSEPAAEPEPEFEPESEPAAEPEPESRPALVAMATPRRVDPPAAPAGKPTVVAQDEEEVEEVEDMEEDEVPAPPEMEEEDLPPPPPAEEEAIEEPAAEFEDEVPTPVEDVDEMEDDIPPPPEDDGSMDVPDEAIDEVPPPPPTDEESAEVVEDIPAAPEYSEVADRVEVTGALKDMTWVGFQQTMEASRVFVKTNAPVRYHVTEEGDNLIVLELENTRIPVRNNSRFLDTHFFDTAVTLITPREIEGVSRNVRIEIQVRGRVPYDAGQDENMVYINFQRP